MEGVEDEDLPNPAEVSRLLEKFTEFRWTRDLESPQQLRPWIHLTLPMILGGDPFGVWLLGRRDPDDYYPPWLVSDLLLIVHQTAIALSNIFQTEQLHALYQSDIDRQEAARARFARWLHDGVLSELSALKMNAQATGQSEQFDEIWQSLVDDIRRMIPGIRPVMLSYGLGEAIAELRDDLNGNHSEGAIVKIRITDTGARYGERAEGHLFRIIQQACENAIQHAQANKILIYGDLDPTHLDLAIEDDGCGFEIEDKLDIDSLLAERHFGLVNMQERASLIGAKLRIYSTLDCGTRVEVFYEPPGIHPP